VKRRTVFSTLLLIAALGAVAFAPAGSPASPAEPAEGQILDDTVEYACNVQNFLSSASDMDCGSGVADPDDQTNVSLYQAGLQTDAGNNQYFDLFQNQLETTEEVAWMRAERAAARAATNGSTETAANVDVSESLEEYYTVHQRNYLDKWNMYVAGLESYKSQAQTTPYDMFTVRHHKTEGSNSANQYDPTLQDIGIDGFSNTSITLFDGSSMEVRSPDLTITAHSEYDGGITETQTFSLTPKNANERKSVTWTHTPYDTTANLNLSTVPRYIQLNPPNEDYDTRNWLSFQRYQTEYERMDTQLDNMTTQTEDWLSGVYPALNDGTINPEDLVSNINRMFNYAAEGGANATYSESYVALASLGLDPAGNSSYLSLTYEHDGTSGSVTNDGMLLSDTAPGGSWEVGKTYDSGNISGPQMVVTVNGSEHTINGTFEINGAYNDDGTEISNPTLDAPGNDYEVSNTTETQQLVQQLSKKINEYHNRTAPDAGGGGGNGLGGVGGLGNIFGGLASSVAGLLGIPLRQVVVAGGALVLAVVILK